MEQITFGSTGLVVGRTGFGAIPIQRISYEASTEILRTAYNAGVTLYDTANGYTTSEDRIGTALGDVRKNIVICTKSGKQKPEEIIADLENSLKMLRTDYVDVFQFHCPGFVPRPDDGYGIYEAIAQAKQAGKVRHIGISAHKLHLGYEAVKSGLYEVVQYPFSYLSNYEEMNLVDAAKQHNVGLLGMKALCGGLLTNARAAFAFLRDYPQIVPIWGIEKLSELNEFLEYEKNPPQMTADLQAQIDYDREELAGKFCRGCGYCLPCRAEIPVPMAARIVFLLRRNLYENFSTEYWQANMRKIDNCTGCQHCSAHCPYELDVPKLLKAQQREYFEVVGR